MSVSAWCAAGESSGPVAVAGAPVAIDPTAVSAAAVSPRGELWVSMSVPSDGSYGVTEGIVSSFPCTVKDGAYEIVQGIELSDFSKQRIQASVARLEGERDAVKELGLI